MLKVGAEAAVNGYSSPLIVEQPRVRPPYVYHRLDRDHHAFAQPWTVSARSVIGNLRFFVQPGSNAVSHEFADNAEAVGFHHLLNRRADIPNRAADAGCLDRPVKRCLGYIEQLLDLRLQVVAYRDRDR